MKKMKKEDISEKARDKINELNHQLTRKKKLMSPKAKHMIEKLQEKIKKDEDKVHAILYLILDNLAILSFLQKPRRWLQISRKR